jgi:Mn-dependent DtxR family transcriptional regulator
MNVIEYAQSLLELKKSHGSIANTAKAAGISKTQCFRFLNLLKQPIEIQELVNSGSLPIEQPLINAKSINKKNRVTKANSVYAGKREYAIIDLFKHSRYLTQHQLARYLNVSAPIVHNSLAILTSLSLVEVNNEFRPHAYTLTTKGCDLAEIHKNKHFMSANAIHQRLLRNNIELDMQVVNKSASFINRKVCWEMGFYPSVGEHLVRYDHNGSQQFALILIDDYLMSSSRMLHAIERYHDKDKSTVKGNNIMRWRDIINTLIIYSTVEEQSLRHKKYISKNLKDLDVKCDSRYTASLWNFV